jgi:hypothetical protein
LLVGCLPYLHRLLSGSSALAVDNVGGSNGWYIGLVTMLGGALLVGGEVKVLFNTLVFGKVAPQWWLAVY